MAKCKRMANCTVTTTTTGGDVGEQGAGLRSCPVLSCPVCRCRRGSMLSTAIFVYAATSPVNGYFGGSLYAKQGGTSYLFSPLFAK